MVDRSTLLDTSSMVSLEFSSFIANISICLGPSTVARVAYTLEARTNGSVLTWPEQEHIFHHGFSSDKVCGRGCEVWVWV